MIQQIQLSLLHLFMNLVQLPQACRVTSRRSHQTCSIKNGVLKKFRKNHRKTPVPETCKFIKNGTLEIFKSPFFIEHFRTTTAALRKGSLLLFTRLPRVFYPHLVYFGRMKGWVNHAPCFESGISNPVQAIVPQQSHLYHVAIITYRTSWYSQIIN